MNDFLSFRTMITPVIIQIIFWIGVVLCILGGLFYLLVGYSYYGTNAPIFGLLLIIFGPIGVRIYCEILIIFFRINETLTEIKHILQERRTAPLIPEA
ncbi:MAG: DUF4282 domain-containing protein [Desulfobaccales bacterium]